MTQNVRRHGATLAGEITRLSLNAENRRSLRAMPLFEVENALPERFRQLLAELDEQPSDALAANCGSRIGPRIGIGSR